MRYEQPLYGHRSSLEPVLLAASVPARGGERVIDAGTGAGAALLCLASRCPGLGGVGIEAEPEAAALAARNLAANGFATFCIWQGRLEAFAAAEPFDHAMTNPPWHHAAGTPSPDAARALARRADPDLPRRWAARLADHLRHRGTLTVITGASAVPEWMSALPKAGLGSPSLFPLWPREGRAAKLAILRVVRGGRAPLRLLPGLVLHQADGSFTPLAGAVLRSGAALGW